MLECNAIRVNNKQQLSHLSFYFANKHYTEPTLMYIEFRKIIRSDNRH